MSPEWLTTIVVCRSYSMSLHAATHTHQPRRLQVLQKEHVEWGGFTCTGHFRATTLALLYIGIEIIIVVMTKTECILWDTCPTRGQRDPVGPISSFYVAHCCSTCMCFFFFLNNKLCCIESVLMFTDSVLADWPGPGFVKKKNFGCSIV